MITWNKVKKKLKLNKKDKEVIEKEKAKILKEVNKMLGRWKTNLSDWDKHIRFGFLIPFFWGFHKMQSKINPKLAGKREDRIADLARGLSEASHRPYDECYADIRYEWDNFDKNGIKGWDCK